MINTDKFSESLRRKGINRDNKTILVSELAGSEQEIDLTVPPNCNGVGRIRHFRSKTNEGWPNNQLPIEPARRWLNLEDTNEMRAQVFQNAICNWRCWYCYVPFTHLNGSEERGKWLSADDLLTLWESEPNRPKVIDLSGGQPDLTPEWIPWIIKEVQDRNLCDEVYLWSDDNLSNFYFWDFLTDEEVQLVCNYKGYGKVCCFKGFDETSFGFNTGAEPEFFNRQFEVFERAISTGFDLYGYATFTGLKSKDLGGAMNRFIDRIQSIDESFPLRLVPLQVERFTPNQATDTKRREEAFRVQDLAIIEWTKCIYERFSSDSEKLGIYDF